MRELLISLVEEALLAPSVHNVQPARWRLETDGVTLFEDKSRRLAIGDPGCNDAGISLGAAAEGFRLAASAKGWTVQAHQTQPENVPNPLRVVARYKLEQKDEPDPLSALVHARQSWRRKFVTPTKDDRYAAQKLSAPDAIIASDPEELRNLARRYDHSSYKFVNDDDFRSELLGWMRISRRHPDWSRDGLNADAMALGGIEKLGAALILGPAFRLCHRLGLAPALLKEEAKFKNAAAVILFHRPRDEDPFESGIQFYRLWLSIEAAGFGATVLAALADDLEASRAIMRDYGIAESRRLVSSFRIGRRGEEPTPVRARLPLEDVLV
ncbi:hypothetical protein SAMN02745824_0257 [Parasphingorhabdus marina DSM 22363]|uniref:Nitroreductase family protein n=1 Tax=Parasphingorhabdus marina DSM 22363 TaxID=1123272 RepID=A0A1N6CMK3_9SPHN|nr:hypothetical protein [Parasphingorhabdus marina]SIN59722.1 hypothetical protein SAMN02745824_0257 [Parasphingorhabdus marina DSM 22363]